VAALDQCARCLGYDRVVVQWNELMAAALVAALPVMVLYSLLERHLVDAITAGAVKG